MLWKEPKKSTNLFHPVLVVFIDHKHKLVLLAKKIGLIEIVLKKNIPSIRQTEHAHPTYGWRAYVQAYVKFCDETIVEVWVGTPYFYYFCDEVLCQHRFPCDPNSSVHFRK